MNPFNNTLISSIQRVLNDKLISVTLKVNNKRSNLKENDDFLALRHLEMMTKENLNNFENLNPATPADIDEMKNRLKRTFLKNIHSSHINDITSNQTFKTKLREFMNQVCEYSDLSVLAIKYHETLQAEAKNLESDGPAKDEAVRKIEAARSAFLNDEKIEKLKQMETDNSDKTSTLR